MKKKKKIHQNPKTNKITNNNNNKRKTKPEDKRELCYPFNKHIRSECLFLLWILQTLNNKHKSVILNLYKWVRMFPVNIFTFPSLMWLCWIVSIYPFHHTLFLSSNGLRSFNSQSFWLSLFVAYILSSLLQHLFITISLYACFFFSER